MQLITEYSDREVSDFFKEKTEFEVLLEPFAKAMKWPGRFRSLVELLPHFSERMDISDFRNITTLMGYKSEMIKIPLSQVDPNLTPFIYLPEDETALLVLKKSGDYHVVIDGETGQESVVMDKEGLEGTCLIFTRQELTKEDKMRINKNWFGKHLLRYGWVFLQILIIGLFLNLFTLILPLYVMNTYNLIIPSKSVSMLINFTIAILAVMCSSNILNMLRTKMITFIGIRVDKAVNEIVIKTLLYLPTTNTENFPVGKQIARIKEFGGIRDVFTSPLMIVLFEFPFTLVLIITIGILGGSLAFIPVVMIFVYALVYYLSKISSDKNNQEHRKASSFKQSFLLETLTYLHDIKALGAEDTWFQRYKEKSAQAMVSEFRSSFSSAVIGNFSDTLMMVAGLGVIAFGTFKAMGGDLKFGALIAIMMLTWKTLSPLKSFFSSMPKISQLFNSIKQVNALTNLHTENMDRAEIVPVKALEGVIEFSRVGFRYNAKSPPAVVNVSFEINPGEMVCVIGGSGSGKSTILKLLLRLYSPQTGNIYANNLNIAQLDVIELRHIISYQPQNIKLFYGTIYQNLLFANLVASDKEVEVATRLASLYDDIMRLPEGFNTRIGDQSSISISASFQQRLGLARAFLKRSSILLLDEPENTLDDHADHDFFDVLKYYKGRKTIILSTHRPAHIKLADRVLYFKEGQLIYNGKPEDVLKKVSIHDL